VPLIENVKQDATKALAVLLALHLVAVSFNRAPGREGIYVGQALWMTLTTPILFVAANGLGSFRKVWNHYFSLRDARSENEQLRAQLAQMQTQAVAAEDKAKVAEQLDTYVKWRSSQQYKTIDANVIGRDASQWFNTVTIDQGSFAGIRKDMPVVTPEGLVGRIIVVAPTASRVLLITDQRHGAGSIIGQYVNRRSLGAVVGKSGGVCEMRFGVAADKVAPNEVVITSGQDGIYPRGLVIGRVRINPGGPGVPQSLEIVPAAQLDRLEMVAVLDVPSDQVRSRLEELQQVETEKQQAEKAQGRATR
jgi:rod shape-determining protein MreC